MIVGIQHGEFNVNITAEDQPDLKNIPNFYQTGKGNFWIALFNHKVVGTISLVDIGNNQVGLRKMFVKDGFRGKPLFTGQALMDIAYTWCTKKGIKQIFLGTVPHYFAAHRFYERNGFKQLQKSQLPKAFHIMNADKLFYFRDL